MQNDDSGMNVQWKNSNNSSKWLHFKCNRRLIGLLGIGKKSKNKREKLFNFEKSLEK